jgi:hypothetical protein
MSALFGWPVVIGVSIGGLLTNAYYFLAPVDVVLGPIANLVAAIIIMTLRKRRLLACIIGALPIPDRDLTGVEYASEIFGIKVATRRFTSIISSRGCPFRCSFCGCRKFARARGDLDQLKT